MLLLKDETLSSKSGQTVDFVTLFETGPGSLSIQSQTFTALNYLQFSLETRWLGVIYLLTYLCFTSMLQ